MMSDSDKLLSDFLAKKAKNARRKRLRILQDRSSLMDNKTPGSDRKFIEDTACWGKKKRRATGSAADDFTDFPQNVTDESDAKVSLSEESGVEPVGMVVSVEEEEKTLNYISYGIISVIGRRRLMEDAVTVVPGDEFAFFAVYDGHGGDRVSKACRSRLHELVLEEINAEMAVAGCCGEKEWEKLMKECFRKMDEEVNDGGCGGGIEGCSVVKGKTVGSTAVVVIVGTEEVVVANCGDSRAVMCRGGSPVALSLDHKPDRADERERVEAAGGRVIDWNGSRVLGVLATSRSIGDQYLKPYVIAEPEVKVIKRTGADEFLTIASDGFWDVVTNEFACKVVRKCLNGQMRTRFTEGTSSAVAAAMLAELALARGSRDNISVIIVELKRCSSN